MYLRFIKLTAEEEKQFKELYFKYQKKEFIETIKKNSPERFFTPDDKFYGKEYEFIIFEELSEEQESFLLAENNLVSELFKEDKKIEVYSFDENTTEEEIRKLFYGDKENE